MIDTHLFQSRTAYRTALALSCLDLHSWVLIQAYWTVCRLLIIISTPSLHILYNSLTEKYRNNFFTDTYFSNLVIEDLDFLILLLSFENREKLLEDILFIINKSFHCLPLVMAFSNFMAGNEGSGHQNRSCKECSRLHRVIPLMELS
jgi:hypothetical protein